eukprot:CAMPEP_0203845654 /NCGR_PEP_ID=MMETSP0359-20131031/3937_1 /ASSEMBLY_ACC=CAM_ASM_000338 /TAXON_ID=268821 /ORGANISM="Scrippsiella Hangoei, Strain SHTV-5" /LENGTH=148 /DNA_ID=CAMNT_0050760825 /DNA_START=480 /DNA_END=926 /DNA_ORIENTATION=-
MYCADIPHGAVCVASGSESASWTGAASKSGSGFLACRRQNALAQQHTHAIKIILAMEQPTPTSHSEPEVSFGLVDDVVLIVAVVVGVIVSVGVISFAFVVVAEPVTTVVVVTLVVVAVVVVGAGVVVVGAGVVVVGSGVVVACASSET